jgi:hypothetical protein
MYYSGKVDKKLSKIKGNKKHRGLEKKLNIRLYKMLG